MRRAPRSVTVAAALIAGAALAGCGTTAEPPVTVVSPPDPLVSHVPVAVAEPAAAEPLAPPRAMPEPPAPTAHYTPAEPAPSTTPPASPSPTPSAGPSASPSPTPSSEPGEARLVALLPSAAALPPLSWTDGTGVHSTRWIEITPAAAIPRASALPHVAAARSTDGACASAADAVDGRAVDAAIVTLAADPAPGDPIDLVLVRYPSPSAAAAAVVAVQALGVACEGIVTAGGTLGTATPLLSATAVLTGDGAPHTVEVTGEGTMLIAIVHEGAPPEAVAALVAAQLVKLG